MAEAISWIAVNKSGEICLDSDLPPLPRGWERCLDLQSGIMYLKQMDTQGGGATLSDGNGKSIALQREKNAHKRQKILLSADDGEGDPALQLTLSLPTSNNNNTHHLRLDATLAHARTRTAHPSNHIGALNDATSLINNGLNYLASQATPIREDATTTTTTSSNGSSPSHNACSSSSSSSPSKHKQWGLQSIVGLRANKLNHQEGSMIRAAGCPHCFMYVLPSKSNPRCPRCKSSILVDLSPLTIIH